MAATKNRIVEREALLSAVQARVDTYFEVVRLLRANACV